MAAVANSLQRRLFMANRNRVQLILGRRFPTGIHEEIKWRLAKADDFGDVVKLSEGIWGGYDFIPIVFHEWLQRENVAIMLLYAGRNLIGLEAAGCIVDSGKTLVRRGGRIAPNLRGQGLLRTIVHAWHEYVRANLPKISRERMATFPEIKTESVNPFKKILERDELSFFVEESPRGNFNRRDIYLNEVLSPVENELKIESCTQEYFSNVILSAA